MERRTQLLTQAKTQLTTSCRNFVTNNEPYIERYNREFGARFQSSRIRPQVSGIWAGMTKRQVLMTKANGFWGSGV